MQKTWKDKVILGLAGPVLCAQPAGKISQNCKLI